MLQDPQLWQASETLQVPKWWQLAMWQQAADLERNQTQAGMAACPSTEAGPGQGDTRQWRARDRDMDRHDMQIDVGYLLS